VIFGVTLLLCRLCHEFWGTRLLSVFYLSKIKIQQSHYRPGKALRVSRGWGSQISRLSAYEGGKFISPTHWPHLSPHFCYRLIRPQGHSAAGRIVLMKSASHIIGNRTRDLAACSAVPQSTEPSHAPLCKFHVKYFSWDFEKKEGNVTTRSWERGFTCEW
jgi:hypothetical protein